MRNSSKKKPNQDSETICVYLPDSQIRQLEALAAKRFTSKSQLAREAIAYYMAIHLPDETAAVAAGPAEALAS